LVRMWVGREQGSEVMVVETVRSEMERLLYEVCIWLRSRQQVELGLVERISQRTPDQMVFELRYYDEQSIASSKLNAFYFHLQRGLLTSARL